MIVPSTASSTLLDLLRLRAWQQPDRRAYSFWSEEGEQTALTYAELDLRARALGAWLQSCARPGERALLLYPPGPDYLVAFWGCLYAGILAVPAYPPRSNGNLERLLAVVRDCDATLALTTDSIHEWAVRRLPEMPGLAALTWLSTEAVDAALADDWQAPVLGADSLAFLQYTSGSTGTPKGVMLSHGNLLHNLELIGNAFGTSPESRGVIWLPPYHDMGLIGGILQPLFSGYPMTLMAPVDFITKPLRWLEAVSQARATVSGGPNFAYELCVQKIAPEQRAGLDLSQWDTAFTGAEPIRAETLDRFAEYFAPCGFRREAFYPCYGLAEGTLFVVGGLKGEVPAVQSFGNEALEQGRAQVADDGEESRLLVGSGRIERHSQQVVLVDPQTGARLPDGQVGEIWVGGPSVAQGYWQRQELTEETFHAYRTDSGEGPFLRTGDLGFVEDGELYVTGRLKDLIIIRGRNHYPQDIEYTVQQSHPAMQADAGAAFSVDLDGEERLVIVQEVSRTHRRGNLAEMAAAIRQRVAEQHQLQVYAVVLIKPASIPKTSSGKIQRRNCRERFLQGGLEEMVRDVIDGGEAASVAGEGQEALTRESWLALPADERERALREDLRRLAATVLKVAPGQLDAGQPLQALGLDSLMAVELKHEAEERYGASLSLASLLEGASVESLVTEVLEQVAGLEAQAVNALEKRIEVQVQGVAGQVESVEGQVRSVEARAQVVQELAGGVASGQAKASHHAPLSYGQRSLWFLQRVAPESSAYHIARAVRLRGAVNLEALRGSFAKLAERHESLRTTFHLQDGEPVQQVQAPGEIAFDVIDAAAWSDEEVQARLVEASEQPFDLAQGPLWRVLVLRRADDEHVLLLTLHHIIADFWSLGLLVQELQALYPALTAGETPHLEKPVSTYSNWANQQTTTLQSERGDTLWAYWRQQLAGDLPVLQLPIDRPRPPVQTYRGSTLRVGLGNELSDGVKQLAQAHGSTLYTVLLAAFQVLLSRYTGQEDILVGSPTAGRGQAKQAGIFGYFVNPVVLRAQVTPELPFCAFLAQAKQTVLGALEHQDYPFALLVERLQLRRDPSCPPLIQAMFVLQRSHALDSQGLTAFALGEGGATFTGPLPFESVALEQRVAQFDLTLQMADTGGALTASFEYNTDLFDRATIGRMAAHFERLLQAIVASPEQEVGRLPLLSAAEEHQLLTEWNDTASLYPRESGIAALFEEQAAKTPYATALLTKEDQVSYADLNKRANRLARHLIKAGVTPGQPVAISVERSPEMIVGVLGILKAGGCYVPVDSEYPQERIAYMLQDAGARILLTQARLQNQLPEGGMTRICLDADWPQIAQESGDNLGQHVSADSLAYLIYTSGSTGRPKGVSVPQRGVVRLVKNNPYVDFAADDVFLQMSPFSFDAATFEIWGSLLGGGRLALYPPELLTAERLAHELVQHGVTTVFFTAALFNQMVERHPDGLLTLRHLITGGEAMSAAHAKRAVQMLPNCRILNGYGPTESTTFACMYPLPEPEQIGANVPIGRPIRNTRCYVLDKAMQPVPIGVPGELYLGGDGVAHGYWRRPELSAERFVHNPFCQDSDETLYKTGDLVRWLPDGNLEYLGRLDHQVKIRGFRIELGEIEAALSQHPELADVIVLAREDAPGDRRLVAYCVPAPSKQVTGADLRTYVQDKMPAYMVPAHVVILEALPLTPNGKVDRRALPAPDGSRDPAVAYVAPKTELERQITAIWQESLGFDQVGMHDNYFDLGGHSLSVVKVHERVQELTGRTFSVVEMFRHPTIASLTQYLNRAADVETKTIADVRGAAGRRRDAIKRQQQLRKDRRK